MELLIKNDFKIIHLIPKKIKEFIINQNTQIILNI